LNFISRKIQHQIVSAVPDQSKKHILKHIDNGFKVYCSRGFNIRDVHTDSEFKCVCQHILPVHLNVVAADLHVGEVEQSIRTIKERNRTTAHGLPYKRIPKLMVQEIVGHSVLCLNQLLDEDRVSDTLSPNTIMTGKPTPDYNLMAFEFGLYVQIYKPTTFATNTL
jgi:hypothetical protein